MINSCNEEESKVKRLIAMLSIVLSTFAGCSPAIAQTMPPTWEQKPVLCGSRQITVDAIEQLKGENLLFRGFDDENRAVAMYLNVETRTFTVIEHLEELDIFCLLTWGRGLMTIGEMLEVERQRQEQESKPEIEEFDLD